MICVIPARGGSKRISQKNLKEIDGLPIIGQTVRRARESNLFSDIFVSTENEEIAQTSMKFGAQLISRPSELADDFTPTLDVISNAVEMLELEPTLLVCCLYPVTPLLNYSRIAQAADVIRQGECDYIFPALPLSNQIQRSFECDLEGRISEFERGKSMMRTQDLGKKYVDAGQFYLGKAENWLQRKAIFSINSSVVILNPWEVLDVDTPEDWEIMESVYYSRRSKLANSSLGGKIE